jgi:hypothetical protein
MRRLIVATALAISFPADVLADNGTQVTASPSRPYVGQTITLTATFVVPCADGVSNASFAIDGKTYAAHATGAYNFTARLKIASLRAGTHKVVFTWSTTMYPDLSCGGSDTITLTVLARPSPIPSPRPRPTPPSAGPSPVDSPSPSESPTPVATTTRVNDIEPTGEVGPDPAVSLGALALYLLAAAAALFVARRL